MGHWHRKTSIAFLVLLCASLPAFAHHSVMAEFDGNNPAALYGTISRVEWTNPHVYIHLDVMDKSGAVVSYVLETYSPTTLEHAGVTKAMFHEGENVHVDAFPSKGNTKTFAYLKAIRFANGKQVAIKTPGFQ